MPPRLNSLRQSYLNGTNHLVTRLVSFSSDVTRGQLDFAAHFTVTEHPAVVAKGILATLDWDESGTLGDIAVPAAILVGREDRLTVPDASRRMAEAITWGSLHEITPAGHSGIVEEAEAYASEIEAAATRPRQDHLPGPRPRNDTSRAPSIGQSGL